MVLKYVIKREQDFTTTYYKKIKNIFGKVKLKKISSKDFFSKFSGKLISPEIHNMSVSDFLCEKHFYNLNNKSGDFNKKINIKILNYKDNITMGTKDNLNYFYGSYSFDFYIYDNNGKALSNVVKLSESKYLETFKPSETFFKAILTSAFSGVYGSMRDEDIYLNTVLPNAKKWVCSECKEKFTTLNELYAHLIEESHYTKDFDIYLYDDELQRVKNTIFKNQLKKVSDIHDLIKEQQK